MRRVSEVQHMPDMVSLTLEPMAMDLPRFRSGTKSNLVRKLQGSK